MKYYKIDPANPSPEAIIAASEAVLRGEVICYPTETVYGLGCDPRNEATCLTINKVKGRKETAPLIVLIRLETAADWILDLERFKPIIDKFWPGPLTILVNPVPVPLAKMVVGPTGAMAFRASATKTTDILLEKCGGIITSTSANRTGENPPSKLKPKDPWLSSFCSVMLDVGKLPPCMPSTVVDIRDFPEKLVIVRGGAIPAGKLWQAFPGTEIVGGSENKA